MDLNVYSSCFLTEFSEETKNNSMVFARFSKEKKRNLVKRGLFFGLLIASRILQPIFKRVMNENCFTSVYALYRGLLWA